MSRILNVESLSTKTYGGVDTDWLEDDDFHIFKFNVPGLKSEDVTVQVVGRDTFQVTGRHTGGIERVGTWHVKERPNSIFVRKFQLPSNVKMNKINSYNSDGVLVVIVPKKKTLIQDIPISKL